MIDDVLGIGVAIQDMDQILLGQVNKSGTELAFGKIGKNPGLVVPFEEVVNCIPSLGQDVVIIVLRELDIGQTNQIRSVQRTCKTEDGAQVVVVTD